MEGMKQRLYPVSDPNTAKLIGKTTGGLRKLIFERKISFVKIGGRCYLDERDIDDFIEKHKIQENGRRR